DTLRNISAQTSALSFQSGVSATAQDFVRSLLRLEPAERLPCHALSHHPWLHARKKTRSKKPTRPPTRKHAPPPVAASSSSDASGSGVSDDEDIAKLQTMLDKITTQDRRVPRGPVAMDLPPADDTPEPLPTFPERVEFYVEYHTILDLPEAEVVGNLLCTWTPAAFTVRGMHGDGAEYVLDEERVRGQLRNGDTFDVAVTATHAPPRVVTWVRLAQICLGLYLAAPSPPELLRLPDDVLERLHASEDLERRLRSLQQAPHRPTPAHVRAAELAGIGRGECFEDGTLRIAFVDGSELTLDGSASTVEFREASGGRYAQFPLGATAAAMPSAIARKLKYVSLFVQAMKKQR
ncbi:hypothetical protein ACHHYP_12910, partial [Achlya hypogyna]